jgi:hypothetical protein
MNIKEQITELQRYSDPKRAFAHTMLQAGDFNVVIKELQVVIKMQTEALENIENQYCDSGCDRAFYAKETLEKTKKLMGE